jgi:ubiquinone/menaquinone biosynthesis C-methylase UbiE
VNVDRTGRRGVVSSIGVEALDAPTLDPATARATLADIATANLLFGGQSAVTWGVERLLEGRPPPAALRVLDVGAGLGDVLVHLQHRFEREGVRVEPLALDWHRTATTVTGARGLPSIAADALALPIADRSVDIVIASQLLHHFSPKAARDVIRELDRVARLGVVIADIRRTFVAAWGIWIAAVLLGFHRVSRRDGVLSVRRGFTLRDLASLTEEAGVSAAVHRRPGFRLVAHWRRAVHAR